ncbi:hypothetical protein HHI36_004388 [Cryptolaemus montrouzieri]|uniref:Transmembrane protein n=1 Tax=Cryptolaemus montrouzieri TaxID=559131 RepID=A0ABD2NRB4_9CUCU
MAWELSLQIIANRPIYSAVYSDSEPETEMGRVEDDSISNNESSTISFAIDEFMVIEWPTQSKNMDLDIGMNEGNEYVSIVTLPTCSNPFLDLGLEDASLVHVPNVFWTIVIFVISMLQVLKKLIDIITTEK